LFEAPAKRDSNLANGDRITLDLPDMRPGDDKGFMGLQKPLRRQLLFHPFQGLIDKIFFLPGIYDDIVVGRLQVKYFVKPDPFKPAAAFYIEIARGAALTAGIVPQDPPFQRFFTGESQPLGRNGFQ